jgi:glycosyltransferase involved in cell wall biosynthesis
MHKRTRVLLLITRAELGGGQTHVADLLRGLRGEFDLHLATGETGYLTGIAHGLGIQTHILPALVQPFHLAKDIAAFHQCRRLIHKIQPDLVHAHTSKAGLLGRAAAKLARVPSVFTAHTWCFTGGTSWKWKLIGTPLERLAGGWSGRIINVSNANRDLALNKGVGEPYKHVTIHNGVADHPLRARPAERAVPRIIMLARFAPQKAQSLLVKAVEGIRTPFELAFVGDGPTRQAVEQQVAHAGLADRIVFLGQRLDVPELLASADIFALFTHWEGFPITILEAMRAGLPSVVSDVGGVREAVHESCGRIVAPGDVAGFRAALEGLLTDADLRIRMGAAARARYESNYTVQSMLEKTVAVYRAVCAGELGDIAGYGLISSKASV